LRARHEGYDAHCSAWRYAAHLGEIPMGRWRDRFGAGGLSHTREAAERFPNAPRLLADCIDHRTPIGTYALDDTLPASVHTSLDVRISCSSEVRAFEEAADRQQAPRRCLWLTSSLLAISPTRMPWRPARSPSRRASPRCNDAAPLTTDPDEQLRRQPAEARRLPNRRCPKRGPAARSHFGPA